MLGTVAVVSGVAAATVAGAAAVTHVRGAVRPLREEGEPTRAAIEAARPLVARTRVRLVARHAVLAGSWLLVACYGLGLAVAGALAG